MDPRDASASKKEEKEYLQKESDNLLFDVGDFSSNCFNFKNVYTYGIFALNWIISKNVQYNKLEDYVYTTHQRTRQKVTKGSNHAQAWVFCR